MVPKDSFVYKLEKFNLRAEHTTALTVYSWKQHGTTDHVTLSRDSIHRPSLELSTVHLLSPGMKIRLVSAAVL